MLGFSFKNLSFKNYGKQILHAIVLKKVKAKDNRIIKAVIELVRVVLLKKSTEQVSRVSEAVTLLLESFTKMPDEVFQTSEQWKSLQCFLIVIWSFKTHTFISVSCNHILKTNVSMSQETSSVYSIDVVVVINSVESNIRTNRIE